MSESVSLPALGESVTEGTVTRWLKKVGDRVEVDEPLLEVSTDKVDTEIPSPVAGVVEAILVAEDETVEVGTALVTIGDGVDAGADVPTALPSDASTVPDEPASEMSTEQLQPDAESTAAATESEAPVVGAAPITPEDVAAAPAETAPIAETASADAPVLTDAASPPAASKPVDDAPVGAASVAPETNFASEALAVVEPAEVQAFDTGAVGISSAPSPTAATLQTTPPEGGTATPDAHAGYVTPLVRKLANERGIELNGLNGTGVGGRIRKQDVLDASSTPAPHSSVEVGVPAQGAAAPPVISALRGTTVPMSRLRKVIAERAVISMQSSAQLTSVVEVDVSRVAALRNRVKNDFFNATGQKLTFLPFFALAATEALASNPIINATIDGDTIVYPPHENIAIAVDTERGLLTPVIRDAAALDLAGFAAQIADLAARTRDNKLKPDELAGGTFTLTNTGSRGALFDTPIVFLPQSAILGTGVVAKRPVVISDASGDAIAVRSMVYLALSYDHRIVDGADAARFLVAVKRRLEGGDFEKNLGI